VAEVLAHQPVERCVPTLERGVHAGVGVAVHGGEQVVELLARGGERLLDHHVAGPAVQELDGERAVCVVIPGQHGVLDLFVVSGRGRRVQRRAGLDRYRSELGRVDLVDAGQVESPVQVGDGVHLGVLAEPEHVVGRPVGGEGAGLDPLAHGAGGRTRGRGGPARRRVGQHGADPRPGGRAQRRRGALLGLPPGEGVELVGCVGPQVPPGVDTADVVARRSGERGLFQRAYQLPGHHDALHALGGAGGHERHRHVAVDLLGPARPDGQPGVVADRLALARTDLAQHPGGPEGPGVGEHHAEVAGTDEELVPGGPDRGLDLHAHPNRARYHGLVQVAAVPAAGVVK
jgi:hypothetical protein